MRERQDNPNPIKTIKSLTDQRTFLQRYFEGRTNTLDRIGVAPDVQVRVDPTASLAEIHEKVLLPTRRIQSARETVAKSLEKIDQEISLVDGQLESSAPIFVAGVAQGRDELAELAGYAEVGLVPQELLEKVTSEYEAFTGLPEKHPPLRRGLDLLSVHEKEVGPQPDEKADNKAIEEEVTYELPSGKVLSGDTARVVALLNGRTDVLRGATIAHEVWPEKEWSDASALTAVQQLMRHVREDLEGTGVTLVSKRGRSGGYLLGETSGTVDAVEEETPRAEKVVLERQNPVEARTEVVVFEPAIVAEKSVEQLKEELLACDPTIENKLLSYVLTIENGKLTNGTDRISLARLKRYFSELDRVKPISVRKSESIESREDSGELLLDVSNATALLYLTMMQEKGKPLPKELQHVVKIVAGDVHTALSEQRRRQNGE